MIGYLAAYIFGSFARGEATEHSDLDVHVIVNEDNPCANINHPIIAGVTLDLSFCSLKQLKERTSLEMEQGIRRVERKLETGDKAHIYNDENQIVLQLRHEVLTEESLLEPSFKPIQAI
jgi:nucleotidyltransferase-like protein